MDSKNKVRNKLSYTLLNVVFVAEKNYAAPENFTVLYLLKDEADK